MKSFFKRSVFAICTIVLSQLAHAHPLLSDPTSAISAGSTVTILYPLNVPRNFERIYVQRGRRVPNRDVLKACELEMKSVSRTDDRTVLPREMLISDIETTVGAYYVYFSVTVRDPAVAGIFCAVPNNGQGDTIENFLRGIQGIGGFQMRYPQPVKVDFDQNPEDVWASGLQNL